MKLPDNTRDWPAEWRELYEERAGIMEHEGQMPRKKAEQEAEKDTRRSYAQFMQST